MLRCLILKMILFRCSVNNTNCRSAVQTGRCVQCTVQSFIETFTVAYFLNNHSVCCNPNPITAFTRTNKIMQFSHTDRTNSVHLASCCCSVSVCMQLFILHGRTFRTVFVLRNVLPVWGSENEWFAQNVTWDIKYCAVPSTQQDRCLGNFNFSCIENSFCLQMLQFIATALYNSDSD